ncbi:MAG: hypothetical protein ACE5H8_03870 [Alphaproteobacteria bacterium]
MNRRRAALDAAMLHELLERVGNGTPLGQRALAGELGVALGLANAYLKRCLDDGLIAHVGKDGRRFRYRLTDKGDAERRRLAGRRLRESAALFGIARDSFDRLYARLVGRGVERVVLCGVDELTEIAVLCSLGSGIRPIGVWRHAGRPTGVRGVPGVLLGNVVDADAVVISVAHSVESVFSALRHRLAAERIAVPDVLDFTPPDGT